MSLERVTMFRVGCDGPVDGDCTATAQDDGDYWAWSSADGAEQDAADGGWQVRGPFLHLCLEHDRTVCWGNDFKCDRRDVTEADDGWMYCPDHKAEGMDNDSKEGTT